MAHTQIPTKQHIVGGPPGTATSNRYPAAIEGKPGRRRISPFWRHFLQMLAAMTVGMIATCAIFLSIVGLKTWDEVTSQYPTQALMAMAVGMTIPMVVWMLIRGMGWKNSYEMAAAMVLPVIPFLCLVWFGITDSAWCGAYCVVTILAMLALMRHRRSEYATPGDSRCVER